MKKPSLNKTTALLLGTGSLLVLFLLAAGLGQFQFKSARPFTYEQPPVSSLRISPPTWNGLVFVIMLMFAVLIVVFILLPPELRKKYLLAFGLLALAVSATLLILSYLGLGKPVQPPQEASGNVMISPVPAPTNTLAPAVTPAVFTPPSIPDWGSFLVALVVLLALAAFTGWFYWSRKKTSAPYENLAEIARSAPKDIQSGKDWGNAVLNSYQHMTIAVADWRGIRRKAGMTPGEFSATLESAHLPVEAIHRLTQLFERVRYGQKRSNPGDIREAVECLTTILDYCHSVR